MDQVSRCVALALSATIAAEFHRKPSKMIRPFDYREAIGSAAPGARIDRRPELKHCVQQWAIHERDRSDLFRAIHQGAYLNQPGMVLLEVGNSGFGRYGVVLIAKGEVRLGNTDAGPHESPSGASLTQLRGFVPRPRSCTTPTATLTVSR